MANDNNVVIPEFNPTPFNPSVNPNVSGYSNITNFRFWCQTVLPLVYDDSLSYYELLNKVVWYINNLIDDNKKTVETVSDVVTLSNELKTYVETETAEQAIYINETFTTLKNYINDYFTNLSVQNEINNKLDSMANDGTLTALIQPFIIPAVDSWLQENIHGGEYPLDDTLTLANAAAQAKAVGDRFKTDENIIDLNEKGLVNGNLINNVENNPVTNIPMDSSQWALGSIDSATGNFNPMPAGADPNTYKYIATNGYIYLPDYVNSNYYITTYCKAGVACKVFFFDDNKTLIQTVYNYYPFKNVWIPFNAKYARFGLTTYSDTHLEVTDCNKLSVSCASDYNAYNLDLSQYSWTNDAIDYTTGTIMPTNNTLMSEKIPCRFIDYVYGKIVSGSNNVTRFLVFRNSSPIPFRLSNPAYQSGWRVNVNDGDYFRIEYRKTDTQNVIDVSELVHLNVDIYGFSKAKMLSMGRELNIDNVFTENPEQIPITSPRWFFGSISSTDGAFITTENALLKVTSDFISVDNIDEIVIGGNPGVTYVANANDRYARFPRYEYRVTLYDENKNFISSDTTSWARTRTYSLAETKCKYIRVTLFKLGALYPDTPTSTATTEIQAEINAYQLAGLYILGKTARTGYLETYKNSIIARNMYKGVSNQTDQFTLNDVGYVRYGYLASNDGVWNDSATYTCSWFIPIEFVDSVITNCPVIMDDDPELPAPIAFIGAKVFFYDQNRTIIGSAYTYYRRTHTWSAPQNAKYMRIGLVPYARVTGSQTIFDTFPVDCLANVYITLNYRNVSGANIADYLVDGGDIQNQININTLKSSVADHITLQNGFDDCLLFFSDMHPFLSSNTQYYKKCMSTLQKIMYDCNCEYALCGGDWLQSGDTSTQAVQKLNEVTANSNYVFGGKCFQVVGNHDTNYQGYGYDTDPNFEPLSNNILANVMCHNNKTYYVKDTNTTRFYCLDTGTDWDNSWTSNQGHYRIDQLQWLCDSLLNNEKDNLAILMHIFYLENIDPDTHEVIGYYQSEFAKEVIKIIRAFNDRTNYIFNSTYHNISVSFANCIGKIWFIVAGHLHNMYTETVSNIPVYCTEYAIHTGSVSSVPAGTIGGTVILTKYNQTNAVIKFIDIKAGLTTVYNVS